MTTSPPKRQISVTIPAALSFWLSLAMLNGLLFLPMYLLNRGETQFWPVDTIAGQNLPQAVAALIGWRQNLDIFRLYLEPIVLAALWVLLPRLRRHPWRPWYRVFFLLVYLLALVYAIYESFMLTFYQSPPNFYTDFQLIRDNAGFALQSLQLSVGEYVGAALLLGGGIWLIQRLVFVLLDVRRAEQLGRGTCLALLALALLVLATGLRYRTALASPQSEVNALTSKLGENIQLSRHDRAQLAAFSAVDPQRVYDYTGYDLLQKPDIYLIFVESYGSVLYQRSHFRPQYLEAIAQMQKELSDAGYSMATALSEAPTWGAGSWMSYTSAQFGLRIDNQPQFLALKDRYTRQVYPNLGRYLQTQGYFHARLSPLTVHLNEAEWQANTRLYGVDRWLSYNDIDYHGSLYGWGPAPPDQYSLNYARATLKEEIKQPLYLFFLTQNSHYPWAPLPTMAPDWHDLQQKADPEPQPVHEPISYRDKITHYPAAIRYELAFLSDFIRNSDSDNAIFVLIGDHQPPAVSRREDGFATPIHVISKDANFISEFLEYGFKQGLVLEDLTPPLYHEGFYSMFVRSLLRCYGVNSSALPPYLPQGIPITPKETPPPAKD